MYQSARHPALQRALLAAVVVAVLARFAAAAIAPLMQDEAYYLAWTKALDLGYFDHPPAVAWLGLTSLLAPASAFAGRLGGLLVGALTIPLCIGLFRRAGLSEPRVLLAAFVLSAFNLTGLACGVLVVPDTLYFVAWCAALHEAAAALDGHPRRWLTAGLATGLGLLSKYTMVLMFPVLLIAALRGRPRQLRSPWPWLGAAIALAVFAPHLWWNAENHWIPLRYQFERRLVAAESSPREPSADGPRITAAGPAELALAKQMGYEEVRAERPVARAEERSKPRRLAHFGGYLAGLASWWGALIVLIAGYFVARLRGRAPAASPIRPHLRPLLVAAAIVPVAVFGLASLRSQIEANWAAAYTVGACALLAGYGAQRLQALLWCSAVNALILVALAVHARSPLYASNEDRLLSEAHGYRELAEVLAKVEGPVFTDRHQTAGQLRFYLPGREITQWPDLTRPSEFTRRPEWNAFVRGDLTARGGFWLVSARILPLGIEGFRATEMLGVTLRAQDGRLLTEVIEADPSVPRVRDSSRAIHRWFVVRYVAIDAAAPQ